jgi:hypothetical protein
MYIVLLAPGVNPISVKFIISYPTISYHHIINYQRINQVSGLAGSTLFKSPFKRTGGKRHSCLKGERAKPEGGIILKILSRVCSLSFVSCSKPERDERIIRRFKTSTVVLCRFMSSYVLKFPHNYWQFLQKWNKLIANWQIKWKPEDFAVHSASVHR